MFFFYLSFVFFHIFSASVVLSVFAERKRSTSEILSFTCIRHKPHQTSRDDFRTETIEKRHLSFDIKSPYDIF